MKNIDIYKRRLLLNVLFITSFLIKSCSSRILSKRDYNSYTNLCLFIFCQNGGTCYYSNNLAHCKCAQGYFGMWCQFVSMQKPSTQRQIQNYIMTPMIPVAVVNTPATSDSEFSVSQFSICSVVKCQNGKFLVNYIWFLML
jgi:hypothetical protein